MTRLSLCLIARDEEELLPDCLASVKGIVQEIILVDTGSRDRTVEIARDAGAIIVDHPWQDDFAAARNAALPMVSGDWILVLDADERLSSSAGRALLRALEQPNFDLGLLPVYNASTMTATEKQVLSGQHRLGEPTLLGRLLRRTPDLRWVGAIHECTGSWPSPGPRRDRPINAPILHFGYTPILRAGRDKEARDIRMLERMCEEHPSDQAAFAFLARTLIRAGRPDAAETAAKTAWQLLYAKMQDHGPESTTLPKATITTATLWADLLIQHNRRALARAILHEAIGWVGFHPNFSLLLGVSHEQDQLLSPASDAERRTGFTTAALAYQECLAASGLLYPEEISAGATSWFAATRLGAVLLQLEEVRGALIAFEKARLMLPRDTSITDTNLAGRSELECTLGSIEAYIRLDQWREALQALQPLLIHQIPDAWVLAAMACRAGGRRADVAAMLQPAVGVAAARFVSVHRYALLQNLRRGP